MERLKLGPNSQGQPTSSDVGTPTEHGESVPVAEEVVTTTFDERLDLMSDGPPAENSGSYELMSDEGIPSE